MIRTHEFEPCADPRKETCLLCREDGFCNALDNTQNCAFYKDKTHMKEEDVAAYWDETYKEGYKPADQTSVERWQRAGAIISAQLVEKGAIK